MEINRVVGILRRGGDGRAIACTGPEDPRLDGAISRAERTIGSAYGNLTFGDLIPRPGSEPTASPS